MKKALIYGLSAALLLASLIACKNQADQPAEPDPTPTPSAIQTEPVETPEPEETMLQVEPMAKTLPAPTQEVLSDYFQLAYEGGQSVSDLGLDDDSILAWELDGLHIFFDVDPQFEEPADLDAQYLAWREANHPQEPATGATSSNPQTKPIQQAPSTTNNNQQVGGPKHDDPTQSSIFEIPDDPWEGSAHIKNYGGTGGDGSLETGGQRADFSQIPNATDIGFGHTKPGEIEYGGN